MHRMLITLLILLLPWSAWASEGLVTLRSNAGVTETANRLEKAVSEKGMKLFNRIDHAAGAKRAGLSLYPPVVVVFGNPKMGTKLMQCAPLIAIDLPLKALIREDSQGVTWVSYNDPMYLKRRHKISGCDEILEKMSKALYAFASAAAGR